MNPTYDFDYIVIGSGFGGSVSAHRLTEKGYSVAVMEMGRRWAAEDFPKTNWDTRRWMWRPGMKMFGFYNMRMFRHVMVVSGNAVGGGSITYANALLTPAEKVWDEGSWAGLADWKQIMPQHYATAEKMLGVTESKIMGEADRRLLKMAELHGTADTYHPPRVGTFFAADGQEAGKTYPDPYFGGEGPDRGTCVGCGGCMMGCQHNAKNTLDKNYLYLAEKRGAKVFAETRVVDVRPLNGKADGSDGYEIHTECSTSWFNKQRRVFRSRGVVFAASSLGTMELLFKLRDQGSLPNISADLGKRVRTNAESLIGIRFPDGDKSMSPGLAGGASFHLDERTHIGVVRYPEGSDAIGLMMTVLSGGRAGWNRILVWLLTLLLHPLNALRVHNPIGFARQTMLLLVMQTADAHLDMRMKRRWYWPFGKQLVTEGGPIPTFIPEANAFAEKSAKALGGIATTMLSEILFNIPTTAHCMGGCAMADSPARGVMDVQNRVFGYQNMLICDGSMLSANLGVNPSLTITALTEYAMSHIPVKSAMTHFNSASEPRTTYADAANQLIQVGGTAFAYRDLGPRDGVPLILLNHWGAVLDNFDPRIVDGLARQHRVIATNYRGIGASGGSAPVTVDEMARDAIALIRALGFEKVDLLGFSLGGFVAQDIVLKAPGLVRKLILTGTGPAGGTGIDKITSVSWPLMLKGLLTLKDPKSYLFFTSTAKGRQAAKAFLKRIKERKANRDKGPTPRALLRQLKAIIAWGRQPAQDLSKIQIPVLIANGDHDIMVPTVNSTDMARRIPNAQLVIYEDAGHGGIFQNHAPFVSVALSFLKA